MQKSNEEILNAIYTDLQQVKKQIANQQQTEQLSGLWLKRQQVMELLEYGDTQMAAIDKKGILEIAKVGKRKFYKKTSVLKLIESSRI